MYITTPSNQSRCSAKEIKISLPPKSIMKTNTNTKSSRPSLRRLSSFGRVKRLFSCRIKFRGIGNKGGKVSPREGEEEVDSTDNEDDNSDQENKEFAAGVRRSERLRLDVGNSPFNKADASPHSSNFSPLHYGEWVNGKTSPMKRMHSDSSVFEFQEKSAKVRKILRSNTKIINANTHNKKKKREIVQQRKKIVKIR